MNGQVCFLPGSAVTSPTGAAPAKRLLWPHSGDLWFEYWQARDLSLSPDRVAGLFLKGSVLSAWVGLSQAGRLLAYQGPNFTRGAGEASFEFPPS